MDSYDQNEIVMSVVRRLIGVHLSAENAAKLKLAIDNATDPVSLPVRMPFEELVKFMTLEELDAAYANNAGVDWFKCNVIRQRQRIVYADLWDKLWKSSNKFARGEPDCRQR